MDPKITTKRRGIRMAVQVAALAVGAGGAAMAFAADAKADAAPPSTGAAQASPESGDVQPVQPTGWSCWGPISRGPAAPPAQSSGDFDALLAEVPS